MTAPVFTLTPFWLGYAVALAVCVGWAWRLSREAKDRDKATADRDAEREIPRAEMWRAIERERGE